tara:strand:+ start:473 stop:1243 length:771 start_codon:yes stop_codon:yes gene_type:complete
MATLLLKKSFLHKNFKEIKFKDLWNSYGVFTTMRVIGKPPKILFFKEHMDNLIKSMKIYKVYKSGFGKKITKFIQLNLNKNKKYDHLFRVATNNKIISISLRKRPIAKKNFNLKMVNYKRIDSNYKNLKYKKILNILKKLDITNYDIALYKNKKILETGTSNLLFIKHNEIFSPKRDFYKGTTFKFFCKKIKINFTNVFIKNIHNYDEIIIIGSGKGVVSVANIDKINWKRKSFKNYRILSKIYQKTVSRCIRYNG